MTFADWLGGIGAAVILCFTAVNLWRYRRELRKPAFDEARDDD